MEEVILTDHAARRILERDMDPEKVMAVARDAIRAGFAPEGRKVTIERGDMRIVMAGPVIITVHQVTPYGKCQRNKRRRRKCRSTT